MEGNDELNNIYEGYKLVYPNEDALLDKFKNFISTTNIKDLYNRKNFIGHITASAIVIDVEESKILLINHINLSKWLPPGGHVEYSDNSILDAAIRECEEETKLVPNSLRLISPCFNDQIPLDIDSHIIPENKGKAEDLHYHHDFKYLFIYTGDKEIDLNKNDASEFKWESFEKLEQSSSFKRTIEKIRYLLSTEFRTKIFFDNIISKIRLTGSDFKSVVVSHILPGSIVFHQALNKIFPILTIIPKPNSINNSIWKITESEFNLTRILRSEISDPNNKLIELLSKGNDKLILFDIGGYFTNIFKTWPESVTSRIALIIEDTENGHQKYDDIKLPVKVVSVARSPLKDNEDFLVGQSVLFSADSLIREQNELLQYKKCSVFGYGKIGQSITQHLIQRGIKPMVFDTNPIKRIEAFNKLASIPSRKEIIRNSEIIFSATGNKALDINDFKEIKNGCYIFSVTSSDDEMDLEFIESVYAKRPVGKHITQYYNDINNFYLVNDGNAVNFIHSAIMGNFIHLVRSEMILAINEIDNYNMGKINYVSDGLRKEISVVWLNTFQPETSNLDFVLKR